MKRGQTATCEAWTHAFGFELRALVGSEWVQSEVCRTAEDPGAPAGGVADGVRGEGLETIARSPNLRRLPYHCPMSGRIVLSAAFAVAVVTWLAAVAAGQKADPQELKQAEADVPQLVNVLALQRGMTVADVGAGAGAMTLVMARWLGPAGRVYSTDINDDTVRAIHGQAAEWHLDNVVTIVGAQTGTNLPNACCDAIWLRDVYHHLTNPAAEDHSLFEALKPGGRLAIIDFEPQPGSKPPPNVPADRTGHGITNEIVERELTSAGFSVVRTIQPWPPPPDKGDFFLVLANKLGSVERANPPRPRLH